MADETSPEQLQTMLTKWMDWMGCIPAQNKMVDKGIRLSLKGKTVRANNIVSDGPNTEVQELVCGYTIIRAANMDEAVAIANGCALLTSGVMYK